ncbi:hypothetical protein DPMN_090753 [Dreissena polymorpha]|uniref:PHD-type domain-containing protein n=1 Tax=Dreissena polymorpha TaxID=45954 RepID=A0A9D4KYB7_DREPO|nr:hypothetical protein DPMN_090753 [Dreissena polymorpha]
MCGSRRGLSPFNSSKCLDTVQAHMKREHDVRLNQVAYGWGSGLHFKCDRKKGKEKKLLPAFLYQVRLKGKKLNVNHDRMKKCRMKDFPTRISKEQESCRNGSEESSLPIYCVCKGVDDGSFMIACGWCEEWFHGRCVGLTEEGE